VLGDVLSNAVGYMDRNEGVGVMGCRVLNPDRSVQLTCFRFPSLAHLALLASGLHRLRWPRWCGSHRMRHWARDDERDVEVVTGCFMVVRRAVLDHVGLLDESFFFFAEETDWCRRIAMAGWKVRFAPIGEIIHYGGASADQLLERRGLLLGEGLTHLHLKHHGKFSAGAAWLLLWLFNLSRAVAYGVAQSLSGREAHRKRAGYYWTIWRRFGEAWPLMAAVSGANRQGFAQGPCKGCAKPGR
jgi:GT2 family glycosyltransferase